MAAQKLGLYDLLAPQFLLGFGFPGHVDDYLRFASVDVLRSTSDESGIVYSGLLTFGGNGAAAPVRAHRDPKGVVFDWDDVTVEFRLTIPRQGAQFISTALDSIPGNDLQPLFDEFGSVAGPSDYPGIRFRLELLLNLVTLHLGKSWVPGMLGGDLRVIPDPDRAKDDVRFVLPKMVLRYEQQNDLTTAPSFDLVSWGNAGFDAPSDLAAGELVRMDPPIALHVSGRVAFGVDQAILDLSEDSTPPEILAHFGTDESFRGLYLQSIRVLYSNANNGWAFQLAVNDCLISLAGEVSLEAEIDVLGPKTRFEVMTFMYEGKDAKDFTRGVANPATPSLLTHGAATLSNAGIVQVQAIGGVPPYTVHVRLDGDELWDETKRQAAISPNAPNQLRPPGTGTLVITVDDAQPGANQQHFSQTIELTLTAAQLQEDDPDGTPADRKPAEGARQPAELTIVAQNPDPPPHGYGLRFDASGSGSAETVFVDGPVDRATLTVGGAALPLGSNHEAHFDVSDGETVDVTLNYAAGSAVEETFELFFQKERPDERSVTQYIAGVPDPPDVRFSGSRAPGTDAPTGRDAMQQWVARLATPQVRVDASASYEGRDDTVVFNGNLSERRRKVALGIIDGAATVTGGSFTGQKNAEDADRRDNPIDRVAKITGVVSAAAPAVTIQARVRRPARPAPPAPSPSVPSSPTPDPKPNEPPSWFRRVSFRLRLERNVLVLLELFGEVDIETPTEERLRNAAPGHDGDRLGLHPRSGATADPNPEDGVVDFKINVTYDTSTGFLTETLTLGAAPGDRDGLARGEYTRSNPATASDRFTDIAGALLTFLPIVNSAAADVAADPSSAGNWAKLTAELAPLVLIGGTGVFQTRAITLYGGEAKARQALPAGSDPARFSDLGVLLDYGVEFDIDLSIGSLTIKTQKPVKVRYRAIGFNFHLEHEELTYEPIFDTSRGYELDLSDAGIFRLPGVLGDILKVLAARVARVNPLTLELDLGMKVDLGVVTVERFKVKWPLDPPGVPTILPTGVGVNISSVLIGSGYLDLLPNGFQGALDVSIVPVKLRVAASLAVLNIPENPAPGDRRATAVIAGLIVEFPAPIPLGQSGLGIFGFSGLFAMHFQRLEPASAPPIAPALAWLQSAEGEPAKLVNSHGVQLWGPALDRWSFGLGAVLGTAEGGFLINVRGMLVLALPGPRILIFAKVQIITSLPSLGDADLTVGILGVLDLDFNLMQITLGVLVDLEIEDVIQIVIPIEIFFKLDDIRDWHFFLGTLDTKVSALILNIVRARGYFMVAGDKIERFPTADGPATLPGIAVATGLEASIVLGDEDIGLYLKVALGADMGVSFSPHLFIAGGIHFDGELHLFIIGIGAHGRGDVLYDSAGPTTHIHIHVCGEIDFFFFSIEGCVDLVTGTEPPPPPAPPLVRSVFLQSHSPVLTAGQGTDRPIDASLGEALAEGASTPAPIVPIDSVPVIQMLTSPLTPSVTTFTEPITIAPGLTHEGWFDVGDRQVRYTLKALALTPPLPSTTPLPPATWRREQAPGPSGVDKNTDLALFSRIPVTASRALERSTDLDSQVTSRWGDLCSPIAPPACVLWTFCHQPLGWSGDGWRLHGLPWPDPAGTKRDTPPPTSLDVEEPASDTFHRQEDLVAADGGLPFLIPARVIGPSPWRRKPPFPPRPPFIPLPRSVRRAEPPAPIFESIIREFVQPEVPFTVIEPRDGDAPLVTPAHGPLPVAPSLAMSRFDPGLLDECARALQLPQTGRVHVANERLDDPALEDRERNDWTTFVTGEALSVVLFVALDERLMRTARLRQLDVRGSILADDPLLSLPKVEVTGVVTGLPGRWLDPSGPWYAEVAPVALLFVQPDLRHLRRFLIRIPPVAGCSRIQIGGRSKDPLRVPALVVGVIEVCSQAEANRFRDASAIGDEQIRTLNGYLNDDGNVPLLDPGQDYELRVTYGAETRKKPTNAEDTDIHADGDVVQRFRFSTDAHAPERLDPWVLGTTPGNEERLCFYGDSVSIVFNDMAVVQLFSRYGKQLRATLRAADGLPIPSEDVVVKSVPEQISTPYLDALRKLILANELPCIGAVTGRSHGVYTVPIPLRPSMPYTLDIDAVPGDPSSDEPVRPLYRQSFTTSRFPDLDSLVADLRSRLILHRPLQSPLAGLPTTLDPNDPFVLSGVPVVRASDQAIQGALVASGLSAPGPVEVPRVVVLWVVRPGATHHSPVAILLDTMEPLWRTREEPRLETVLDLSSPADPKPPIDPAYQRVVPQSVPGVGLREQGGATIVRYIVSPSGTRTLAMFADGFDPPIGGVPLRVDAERHASALFSIAAQSHPLLNLIIAGRAPWELLDG